MSDIKSTTQEMYSQTIRNNLAKRKRAENRFKLYGKIAIGFAIAFLVILLGSIIKDGYRAFWMHTATLNITISQDRFTGNAPYTEAELRGVNYDAIIVQSLRGKLDVENNRVNRKALKGLVSQEFGFTLREKVLENSDIIGQTMTLTAPLDDQADLYFKGRIKRSVPEENRQLSDQQLDWLDQLRADGQIKAKFNTILFTNSDSTQPEIAGLLGAIVGSFFSLTVTLFLSVPLAVAAAIYLEEFAPKNKITDLVEVNINNLAAVPSIVFGLLGLAVLINTFGLPRSAPVVGGIVLALMVLPTIIISTRASLKAVPPSIRQAGLALGASRTQVVFQHVLPQAAPGIMTGTIISMAQALGETAPLLMIGMVSFVPSVPESIMAPSTALPVQIYIWENASERAFHDRTAAAIIVLLIFMIIMNAAAVLLRRKFERRWQ